MSHFPMDFPMVFPLFQWFSYGFPHLTVSRSAPRAVPRASLQAHGAGEGRRARGGGEAWGGCLTVAGSWLRLICLEKNMGKP